MPASSTGSASAPADGNADNPKTEALKADGSKLNSSAPDDGKGNTGKIAEAKTSASKKDEAAQASAEAPLPGEATAVILSSQGAQKRLVHSVPAKYPRGVRSGDAQGTVVLKAVIDEAGRVEGLRVVEGDETLSVAAKQAVKQWHYRPYVRNGQTLPFQTIVIVDFQRP